MYNFTLTSVPSASLALPSLESRLGGVSANEVNILFIRNEVDYGTYRYRAHNIVKSLNALGIWHAEVFLVDELEFLLAQTNLLDRVCAVVFVRTQWSISCDHFLCALKLRNIPCAYDIDDLIYHDKYVGDIFSAVGAQSQHDFNYWSGYVHTCARVMEHCASAICTNDYLADKIRGDTGKPVSVIQNYMNEPQLLVSEEIYRRRRECGSTGNFVVGYFPGSGSHDKDFALIAEAVYGLMKRHNDVALKIVGFLNLPVMFNEFEKDGRVIKKPLVDYVALQDEIGEVDVNLVPLVDSEFANSKSELKFFEAAACGVVSCVSPVSVYRKCMINGESGFLCAGVDDWNATLEDLYRRRTSLSDIGAKARSVALRQFSARSKVVKERISSVFSNICPIADLILKRANESNVPKISIPDYLSLSWGTLRRIHAKCDKSAPRRVNVLYADLLNSALFGGMATSLHFVLRLCERMGYDLRVVTLCSPSEAGVVDRFVGLYGLKMPERVDYYFRDAARQDDYPPLVYNPEDVFVATLWITGYSLMSSEISARKILLVQDIETYFYCYGDEHLKCASVFQSEQFLPIVNTRLLRDYYAAEGFENIARNGIVFEPAFPLSLYRADGNSFRQKMKRRLFVYARKNTRNVHSYTLHILNEAVRRGVISPDRWEICMAGDASMPAFADIGGIHVYNLGALSWKEYSQLTSTVDLALSLMYTPHPSYPPLDCAASGAVVLTNCYKNKTMDVLGARYSENILAAPLRDEPMLEMFRRAVELVENSALRRSNYEASALLRSWDDSFAPVFHRLRQLGFMFKQEYAGRGEVVVDSQGGCVNKVEHCPSGAHLSVRYLLKQLIPYGLMCMWIRRRYKEEIDKPLMFYPGMLKMFRRLVKFSLPYGVVQFFRAGGRAC